MKRSGFVYLSAVVLLAFGTVPAAAQKITGDITGTVTDASGASVPRATVTAECTTTKFTRSTTTRDTGDYRLAELPVCVYRVSVTAQGFKTTVR